MSSWSTQPRAAFDVETTGRNPREARLVTASIVVVDGAGKVIEEHEWLANPGVEIPEEVTAIHGVTTAHAVEHGLPVADVVGQVSTVLADLFARGIPVIAYNASYDFTVLASEAARHGVAAIDATLVIDPYICNKHVDKYRRGSRTLGALCEEYGIPHDDAHTSAADALATIRLAEALAAKYPALAIDAARLHQAQIGWADAQAADFQGYLRRTKPEAVIEGAWPVLP
ncbi:3'-5' exonuclease [Pseudarthrobacter sp. P1]|uniref:3'-5' exonuclease n=1 Tax=Pseudarthrobacter sp. P1 TaxID=3418418 RepID=UPI003CE9029D